jgi:hypothetical protein
MSIGMWGLLEGWGLEMGFNLKLRLTKILHLQGQLIIREGAY